MSRDNDKVNHVPKRPRVVDTKVKWRVEDELINAVITAAVWSTERKPGTWQKMIEAVHRGAAGTKEGTVNAFFFRAMVNRLLEEFDNLNT
ncbi:MAG: hypothetical protein HFF41_06650 [Lawsonibacter sp.]|nr:hypothetical protein [Lawsonibacter sp.]